MQGIHVNTNYVGARSDIVLLSISGYVDTTTCQELAKIIKGLIENRHYLIISDLGGVTYISSAGWGVFVGEIKNIRDKGGDLKIVQMVPEVFEVFEMLEFNRILNYYDSIEEAINEYDILRGIDITVFDDSVPSTPESSQPMVKVNPPLEVTGVSENSRMADGQSQTTLPVENYPLMEKIKLVVIDNPFQNTRKICKTLNTEKYGYEKVSFFRMRSLLKTLNLETKDKRYRFYRSR